MTIELIRGVLKPHPELALFLALAAGYAFGRIRLFGFSPGSVVGCLLAGVVIGQLGVFVSADVQQAFFLLFLFAIGYRIGPQFFSSLDADMLPQLWVTIVLCVTSLLAAFVCALVFHLDMGAAAGVLAGSVTESATVGAAQGAMQALGLTADRYAVLDASLASAFAVAYLVGTLSVILFQSQVAPRLLTIPLKQACREMEASLGVDPTGRQARESARREIEVRAYRVAARWVGLSVAQAEAAAPADRAIRVERLQRAGAFLDPAPTEVLQSGDVAAVSGERGFLVESGRVIGEEVDDVLLLDMPMETREVVLTHEDDAGRTLAELGALPETRSVFLRGFSRAAAPLPMLPGLRIKRGDVVRLYGVTARVEAAARRLGYALREGEETDMAFVGLFIVLGGLIGLPALHLFGVELGLGLSVGVLVGGLIAGWLHARQRSFGYIPEPALWVFESAGLCAFAAAVGLAAGPRFFTALETSGPELVLASFLVVTFSHAVAVLFGSRILKMNGGVLLGACCGAGTSAAALAAVQSAAESRTPALGYGVGYALGNILLALWGTVLVAMLHGVGAA